MGLPEALSERPALSSPLRSSQVPVPGSRLCLWEDGTELTADDFWSVPDNAELVLLTKGQAWQGCEWREAGGPWALRERVWCAFLQAGCSNSPSTGDKMRDH